MKDFPSDPMRQHNLFMAAICEDFAAAEWDTPRARRILEISRQVNAGEEIAELNAICAAKEAEPFEWNIDGDSGSIAA